MAIYGSAHNSEESIKAIISKNSSRFSFQGRKLTCHLTHLTMSSDHVICQVAKSKSCLQVTWFTLSICLHCQQQFVWISLNLSRSELFSFFICHDQFSFIMQLENGCRLHSIYWKPLIGGKNILREKNESSLFILSWKKASSLLKLRKKKKLLFHILR